MPRKRKPPRLKPCKHCGEMTLRPKFCKDDCAFQYHAIKHEERRLAKKEKAEMEKLKKAYRERMNKKEFDDVLGKKLTALYNKKGINYAGYDQTRSGTTVQQSAIGHGQPNDSSNVCDWGVQLSFTSSGWQ